MENLMEKDIYLKTYEVMEELVKGTFGIVFKVRNKDNGVYYAAKHMLWSKESALEEILILKSITHTNIIGFVGAFEKKGPREEIIMLTEYLSGGGLIERMVADDFNLTESNCSKLVKQILEGVQYLHMNNILHLDLKPENIICVDKDSMEIKIIDFGLARRVDPEKEMKMIYGTPAYMAPEIISYGSISTATDMWAVGVISFTLIAGFSPFEGDTAGQTYINISNCDYDLDCREFDGISENAKDFISGLHQKRQGNRLSAKECLGHDWIVQTQSQSIIKTDNLKKFITKRKWKGVLNVRVALKRIVPHNNLTGDKNVNENYKDTTENSMNVTGENTIVLKSRGGRFYKRRIKRIATKGILVGETQISPRNNVTEGDTSIDDRNDRDSSTESETENDMDNGVNGTEEICIKQENFVGNNIVPKPNGGRFNKRRIKRIATKGILVGETQISFNGVEGDKSIADRNYKDCSAENDTVNDTFQNGTDNDTSGNIMDNCVNGIEEIQIKQENGVGDNNPQININNSGAAEYNGSDKENYKDTIIENDEDTSENEVDNEEEKDAVLKSQIGSVKTYLETNNILKSKGHLVKTYFIIDLKIVSGKNLLNMDLGSKSDPYVKIVLNNKTLMKTTVKNNTSEPVWNEKFTLFIEKHPNSSNLLFQVFDRDLIGKEFMGQASVNLDICDLETLIETNLFLEVGEHSHLKKYKTLGSIKVEMTLSLISEEIANALANFRLERHLKVSP